MNEHIVIEATGYDRVDGRRAYASPLKKITFGRPLRPENAAMEVAVQLWNETSADGPQLQTELPIHQVMDLMIVTARALGYFREAYRLPQLHDPAAPLIDRIGLQGDALPLQVCLNNPQLPADLLAVSNALANLGELTGERLRVLARLLEELD